MRIVLISVYFFAGATLLIYLIAKHARRWVRDSHAENDDIFVQKRKMMFSENGRPFIKFFGLVIALMLFGLSVEVLLSNSN
jgi:hypothetical protein